MNQKSVAPFIIDVDRARIEHAARARRDGDLVETLAAGILQLQDENTALREKVAALEAGQGKP
jgi:hypothetical protein